MNAVASALSKMVFYIVFWVLGLSIGTARASGLDTNSSTSTLQLFSPSPASTTASTTLGILLVLAILLISFLIGYLLQITKFKYLQEAGGALLLGLGVGAIIRYTSTPQTFKTFLVFDQESFLLYLLPPIIFESGYNMKRGHFFYNGGSIAAFAFLGTFIAMLVTGGMIYAVSGVFKWTKYSMSLIDSMIFGALISATDPVTVLSIFSSLKVDRNLYANVFGESVLNDAVAIVLTKAVGRFADTPVTFKAIAFATLDIGVIFFGSLGVALVVTFVCALLFKHSSLYIHTKLELVVLVLFAFMSYVGAEALHCSGIISILFCGMAMKHYVHPNLSIQNRIVSKHAARVVAAIFEMIVFIYLGLAIFSFNTSEVFDWPLILMAFPILLISRAAHVFPLSFIINLFRPSSHKITMSQQIVIWFAGLRGAIAFALSLAVPTSAKVQQVIFTMTLMIDLVSIIVLGGLTIPLLLKLKIPMRGYSEGPTSPRLSMLEDEIDEDENAFAASNIFMRLDNTYLKPFLSRSKIPREMEGDIRAGGIALEMMDDPEPDATSTLRNRKNDHVALDSSGDELQADDSSDELANSQDFKKIPH